MRIRPFYFGAGGRCGVLSRLALLAGSLASIGGCLGDSADDDHLAPDETANLATAGSTAGSTSTRPAAPRNGAAAGGCTTNVTRQNANSPLMTQPKTFFLFWGSFWSSGTGLTERTNLTNAWSKMAQAPEFYAQLQEYGIGRGLFLGSANPTPNLSGSFPAESAIQTQLTGEVGSNGVPINDSNTLYVVMMPQGVQSARDCNSAGCQAFGHHGFATKNNTAVRYAIIEHNTSFDTVNQTISHEIYEAVTDPDEGAGPGGGNSFGSGWRDPSQTNDEVGDLCNLTPQTFEGVVIQQVWSQSSCVCRTAPQVSQPAADPMSQRASNLDFDGDQRSDQIVVRAATATWFSRLSNGGFDLNVQFGVITDVNVPRDYTGDGKTDVAIFRPSSGTWFVRPSNGGTDIVTQFGASTDVLVPADYTGDGKADIAIFRPSSGTWFVLPSEGGGTIANQFGTSTDIPVPGDYTGDGKADLALFRPSNGTWFVRRSDGASDIVTQFGISTDIPVPGDYTGDGKVDVAVFRPSTGTWFVRPSGGGADIVAQFGASTDQPAPGDYDGDNKVDFAVFRPSTATWFVRPSRGGADTVTQFGVSTDQIPYR